MYILLIYKKKATAVINIWKYNFNVHLYVDLEEYMPIHFYTFTYLLCNE